MNTLVLPFAVLCSLGLAGLGLSFLAFFQANTVSRAAERRTRERHLQLEAALEAANETVAGLATEVRELKQQPVAAAVPPTPKSCFNVSTRSQALRMHRRGDSPSHIARVLDVPLQEVELLLKVHRIVLDNLVVTTRPETAANRVSA